MLALGARVLADGVGFGRLVGRWNVYEMSRVHRYGRRCRGAWQDWCEPVLSCNGKNGNGAEHDWAVHEPPLRVYLAWSAGRDGCVMRTSVGAAAIAKAWMAPADCGVMIEDGVGPRRAVHEPPLRVYLAWSAGMDGCIMRTSVGAAAIAKAWMAPADCDVMIEGVGPRWAVHEPPLRVNLAWSAGMDGYVMRTSVGAAAIAKAWMAPADCDVMIEGVGPRWAVHEPTLREYLAWSAGMDACVMTTSVGAAAIAAVWIAPADSGVMIEDGVGPRRAVHEPPLRVNLVWSAGMDGCVMTTSVGAAESQAAHDGQFTNCLYGRRWYDYR